MATISDERAAIRKARATVSDDTLSQIRATVAVLRDLQEIKAQREEEAKEAGRQILELTERKLPDMMDEAGVPNITVAAEGNHPAFSVKIDDRYYANIPVEHAPDAYQYLRSVNADDIIKRQYVVSFGLGDAEAAERFEKLLEANGFLDYDLKEGVPWNTLTAWFRDEYKRKPLSVRAMEVLGATVGRVAKVVKPKKEKA